MSSYSDNLAKILRADKDTMAMAVGTFETLMSQKDAVRDLWIEQGDILEDRLTRLGIEKRDSDDIFRRLLARAAADEKLFLHSIGGTIGDGGHGYQALIDLARSAANVGRGFFLKKEKAAEFLLKEPPQRTIAYFGYKGVDELLRRAELFEVYSALRFVEDKEWLNNVFFKQLNHVTADDFEEREIDVRVLPEQWVGAAEMFVKKKLHNVSHLKELGTIFILPVHVGGAGAALRLLLLVLHYLHEVRFYSRLFVDYAGGPEVDFARRVISALRGDVLDRRFSDEERKWKWMIIQRYLYKEDPNDWRLFEPHINPEALHWARAEEDFVKIGQGIAGADFGFWHDLDHIGGYFPDSSGADVMVSFNLVDTVMDLLDPGIKFGYHHQEALWNKIFSFYAGEETLERLVRQNFTTGYVNLKTVTFEG
mgnify:CR=1 FL=1